MSGDGYIRDQVIPVLALLQATERHLRAGDVLLRVLKVLKLWTPLATASPSPHFFSSMPQTYQCVLIPLNSLLLVRVRVREALDLPCVATEESVEIGSDLVALAVFQVVALLAARLEKVGALLSIACECRQYGRREPR